VMATARLCRLTPQQTLCFALIFALAPIITGAAPRKPQIGRIFFSPAERRHQSDKVMTAGSQRAANSSRAERLAVNGAVSSSTKGRAVWVNGVPIENSAGLRSAWTDSSGRVWLRDDRNIPRRIQTGQAIDPTSGVIEDLLPAGSVARRR
jgi:hypothetical protein